MKALKRLSDGLLVLALVLVVVALVGPTWVWWLAAACLAGSVAASVVRGRRRAGARS